MAIRCRDYTLNVVLLSEVVAQRVEDRWAWAAFEASKAGPKVGFPSGTSPEPIIRK